MAGNQLPYFVPLAKGVRVLHCDALGWVALEKPEGLLSTPNNPSDLKKTIIQAKFSKKEEAYVWFDKTQQKRYFYICHRLDSPTSGILLGSTDPKVAESIRSQFKDRKIQKTYVAVVKGIPRSNSGTWKDGLASKSSDDKKHVRTQVAKTGNLSVTDWSLKKKDDRKRVSFLELKPHTGRTHQLRVQTSERNLPIIGDRTYGDFTFNGRAKKEWGIKRLLLHAQRVEFTPQGGRKTVVESAVPEPFFQLFDK